MGSDPYLMLDSFSHSPQHRLVVTGMESASYVDKVDMRDDLCVGPEVPTIVALSKSAIDESLEIASPRRNRRSV
jgi:hypothetical protein